MQLRGDILHLILCFRSGTGNPGFQPMPPVMDSLWLTFHHHMDLIACLYVWRCLATILAGHLVYECHS